LSMTSERERAPSSGRMDASMWGPGSTENSTELGFTYPRRASRKRASGRMARRLGGSSD
jgi:hypothetical protein